MARFTKQELDDALEYGGKPRTTLMPMAHGEQ